MGSTTLVMVCTRVAPRVAAASSTSRPSSPSTGSKVRTMNGRPMKTIATSTPQGV